MIFKEPVILLFLWLILPVGGRQARFLSAQVLLSQSSAIQATRRAEKELDSDLDNNSDKAFDSLLSALWLAPSNTTAGAYFGLLGPRPGWFNQSNQPLSKKQLVTAASNTTE